MRLKGATISIPAPEDNFALYNRLWMEIRYEKIMRVAEPCGDDFFGTSGM
jgi:hypothetical protein